QRTELVLGLGEPARGDRRPLRVERELLAARQLLERGGTVEGQLGEALFAPDLADFVRLPDEVGAAVEGRDGVVRHGRLVLERRLAEVGPTLRRRIDRRGVELPQRALGEGREGADLLDLVAEELDPERLASGCREDVDEAAPDGELAALLDAVD